LRTAQVRESSVRGCTGRPRRYWAPAEEVGLAEPGLPTASASEAVRHACRAAVTALGRPVSGSELRLYVDALPTRDPLKLALTAGGARTSLTEYLRRAERGRDRTGIRLCRSHLTVRGGAPARFWLGREEDAPAGASSCILDDCVLAYRLERERAGIDWLKRFAASAAGTVDRLASAREALLAQISRELEQAVGDVTAAAQLAQRADDQLLDWDRARVRRGDRMARDLRARRLARARAVAAATDPRLSGVPGADYPRVGVSGAVLMDSLAPLAAVYVDLEGRPSALAVALEHCRRFPNPQLDGALRFGGQQGSDRPAERAALAVVDRAEAVLALVDAHGDAWTRAIVRRGYAVLGETLRDPALIEVLLDQARSGQLVGSWARWVLIAGALTAAPGVEATALMLAASGDADDLRAAILGLALATPEYVSEFLARVRPMVTARECLDILPRAEARAPWTPDHHRFPTVGPTRRFLLHDHLILGSSATSATRCGGSTVSTPLYGRLTASFSAP
jgi:hypothetical protein